MSNKDLVILIPDLDIESCLEGLLPRFFELGTREFNYKILRHPYRDSGCYSKGEDFLRGFSNEYQYGLILLDHHGSNAKGGPEKAESDLEGRLRVNGWGDRASVIIIDPELETWVWSKQEVVASVFGWADGISSLYQWLEECNYLRNAQIKPDDPKEAYESVLRENHKPKSASNFKLLAQSINFKGCQDRSFNKLVSTLRTWFPR